jgi:hypothetical protein
VVAGQPLLVLVRVEIHIMAAAVVLEAIPHPTVIAFLLGRQFMVAAQAERADNKPEFRVLLVQVNLAAMVARQSILQRQYQGLYQQAAAAQQEQAQLPAQVAMVKFV